MYLIVVTGFWAPDLWVVRNGDVGVERHQNTVRPTHLVKGFVLKHSIQLSTIYANCYPPYHPIRNSPKLRFFDSLFATLATWTTSSMYDPRTFTSSPCTESSLRVFILSVLPWCSPFLIHTIIIIKSKCSFIVCRVRVYANYHQPGNARGRRNRVADGIASFQNCLSSSALCEL